MCGIAGIVGLTTGPDRLRERLAEMQARLRHRGPDGEGLHVDVQHHVGLAHTRLAILDLSPAGAQPMQSEDERFTIVFNGEIYNFAALRDELQEQGVAFRSNSDTEVILQCYRRYGVDCARRFVGMFAFAIWDRVERTCFFARGPMGIKPLYIWRNGRTLAFASEIRALLAADLGPRRLSPAALRGYLLFGAVQEPLTLVDQIEVLPAGHTLTWRDGLATTHRFDAYPCGGESAHNVNAAAVVSEALESTVRRHFVSDVPVSIFLSGGIDSTAILALARRCGFNNLRTYSISFDEEEYNEGDLARRTAEHFGAEHCDLRMTAVDGRELFPGFLEALDQPSIDGFNSYCVAKLAHDDGAKVVLSGLGGDELFGGYRSFQAVPQLIRWHHRLAATGPLRTFAGRFAERFAAQDRWRRAGAYLQTSGRMAAAYWAMRGIFTPRETDTLVARYLGASQAGGESEAFGVDPPALATQADQVSYLEMTRYMLNQLLRDSDVMSMAWGLELRVPFVDKQLAATIGRLPAATRLARGKRLVLDAVPEIPPWVAQAPKRGFAFPFELWLKGDWESSLERLDQSSPVRLGSWYRRWSLFTLEHFIRRNQIDSNLAA